MLGLHCGRVWLCTLEHLSSHGEVAYLDAGTSELTFERAPRALIVYRLLLCFQTVGYAAFGLGSIGGSLYLVVVRQAPWAVVPLVGGLGGLFGLAAVSNHRRYRQGQANLESSRRRLEELAARVGQWSEVVPENSTKPRREDL